MHAPAEKVRDHVRVRTIKKHVLEEPVCPFKVVVIGAGRHKCQIYSIIRNPTGENGGILRRIVRE
jgi:hypothetical protein